MPKYLDWFIKKNKIARDLLELELFPNAKEIDESYGMLDCCIHKLKIDTKDENILCIVVGDGHRPRTACTIAFNTRWAAVSIDPALSKLKPSLVELLKTVNRFEFYGCKIEDMRIKKVTDKYDKIIFIHPHSHALLSETVKFYNNYLKFLQKECWLISMPCCVKDNLNIDYYSFVDNCIHSQKNRINIYPIDNCHLSNIFGDTK